MWETTGDGFFSLEEVLLLIILASSNGLKLNALMMDLFVF